mgnify:CR=1 FL=1
MTARRAFGLVVALGASIGFAVLMLSTEPTGGSALAEMVVDRAVEETGSINVVTGVLLDFRGFDTLGEASVIFAAVAAVSAAFAGSVVRPNDAGLGLLVRRTVTYLSPLFLLFPVYIILHGHLSPGGGFQGGVSLAVLLILLTITFGTGRVTASIGPHALHTAEAVGAAAFVLVGLVGVFQGTFFLTNLAAGFPRGVPGRLWSAGAIPILNIIVGAKVASGLGTIFYDLLSTRDA